MNHKFNWVKNSIDWKLDYDKQAFLDQDPAIIQSVMNQLIEKFAQHHREIIDDWCKVCMAEIYEKEGKLFPLDYELIEQKDRDDPFVTRYYYRKRDLEQDELDQEIIRRQKEQILKELIDKPEGEDG